MPFPFKFLVSHRSVCKFTGVQVIDCVVCNARNVQPEHFETENHKTNVSLKEFAYLKKHFKNDNGIAEVSCTVKTSLGSKVDSKDDTIEISVKPNEKVEFIFAVSNASETDDIRFIDLKLLHKHFSFKLANNCKERHLAPRKSGNKLLEEFRVTFSSPYIGQYETPLLFLFEKTGNNEGLHILKEMVVYVEQSKVNHGKIISPYEKKGVWAKQLIKSNSSDAFRGDDDIFTIPKNFKAIFANSLIVTEDSSEAEKALTEEIRKVFDIGLTQKNYVKFFHYVLWYEETIHRCNIKKYNMSGVKLELHPTSHGTCYALHVPGLAEKRPSLLIGDLLFIKPLDQDEFIFEAVVKELNENTAFIGGLHKSFNDFNVLKNRFDVRFFMSRVPLERMHNAIHSVMQGGHKNLIFPDEKAKEGVIIPQIVNFFNPDVEANMEQRTAVEHIVAGSPGMAPYLLHGPPGTGKTVTIVEAILQLVLADPANCVMVCTDSNMAADHVATMLVKYSHMFDKNGWLLRANSKFRPWDTLPACLHKYSNGNSSQNFRNVEIEEFMSHSIVVTTLSHSAKFARQLVRFNYKRHITHLFIDEAAQASEPACLVPVSGLLRPGGTLVLAGDPHQLGPVIISQSASMIGLGKSLMERLMKDCPLYGKDDPNYTVMLRDNFRSHPDILEIPDKLFYNGQLRALAKPDEISEVNILGQSDQPSHAVVFHGILSTEQRMGKSPSFFNVLECEIVQLYVHRLVKVLKVPQEDIGIVTPYIRQVYQIKRSISQWDKVEVGTVESFQGKEKRVIIISTVRANSNMLGHDAKFQLGFLVDDRRFNVAITRAKAKCIIIGNPLCLQKDIKWRMYMQQCRVLGTYHGFDASDLDHEATRTEIVENLTPVLKGLQITYKSETSVSSYMQRGTGSRGGRFPKVRE